MADLRGQWIALRPGEPPLFFLVYDSGGTVGLNVEVFSWEVWYDSYRDSPAQWHTFRPKLSAGSRLMPFVADTDGDATLEVLVASEVSNSSGAEGTPRIYDVWAWRDGKFERLGELPSEKLQAMNGRIPL
jgi:hypothetical protein